MKARLSTYVECRRAMTPNGNYLWRAYFRGTGNLVKQADGQDVPPGFTAQAVRRYMLAHPMERGVVIDLTA